MATVATADLDGHTRAQLLRNHTHVLTRSKASEPLHKHPLFATHPPSLRSWKYILPDPHNVTTPSDRTRLGRTERDMHRRTHTHRSVCTYIRIGIRRREKTEGEHGHSIKGANRVTGIQTFNYLIPSSVPPPTPFFTDNFQQVSSFDSFGFFQLPWSRACVCPSRSPKLL